jgi:hypothetical membrane protein
MKIILISLLGTIAIILVLGFVIAAYHLNEHEFDTKKNHI